MTPVANGVFPQFGARLEPEFLFRGHLRSSYVRVTYFELGQCAWDWHAWSDVKSVRAWIHNRKWAKTARVWGREHAGSSEDHAYWLAVEPVMEWVNLKVSGDRRIWPLSWFLMSLPEEFVPVDYALSIGCGPGNLEREVMRHGSASRITGIDVSAKSLEIAATLAREAGYAKQIEYRLSDAESWLRDLENEPDIGLIFFHASLHHIERLEPVLSLCAERLREGKPGLLYVDEYIGPSRDEWNPGHLGYAAALFERVPSEFRVGRKLVPPVAYDDPTEMVRSSEIEAVLRETFEITVYRPYFGNVVMPLVSGIDTAGRQDPRIQTLLNEAMDLEDYLAERRLIEPLYAVFVAQAR